jgi:hypothetical protein
VLSDIRKSLKREFRSKLDIHLKVLQKLRDYETSRAI